MAAPPTGYGTGMTDAPDPRLPRPADEPPRRERPGGPVTQPDPEAPGNYVDDTETDDLPEPNEPA